MDFFKPSKSKKHGSKKAPVPLLADSKNSNTMLSSNCTSTKPTKTRARSATTVGPRRAAFNDKSNHSLKLEPLDEALPGFTGLRIKPTYYEDLYTLTAYGEIPLPVSPTLITEPDPQSPFGSVRGPTSPATRLFEVAKPPAMAKRRRYTVASSRPLLKENNTNIVGNESFGKLSDEASTGNANHILQTSVPWSSTSHPSCDSALLASPPCSVASGKCVEVCSGPLATSCLPPRKPSRPSHDLNVNVRFIKHYPYMIPVLPGSPQTRSEAEDDGVLSRRKYRLVMGPQ
ncbi:hypothetical protein BDP27DRAFT_1415388 [Rhodocollybia butyracea]|uniref:Uncharacterized protein n=1 Tax=Rhodocollybia butyracea TaxID=206335 RepID=A0A9P5UDW8_9AGAR|nr:hypothetical protein BDP27DRAFT_1415388 [Rhodocollybia butyracea]